MAFIKATNYCCGATTPSLLTDQQYFYASIGNQKSYAPILVNKDVIYFQEADIQNLPSVVDKRLESSITGPTSFTCGQNKDLYLSTVGPKAMDVTKNPSYYIFNHQQSAYCDDLYNNGLPALNQHRNVMTDVQQHEKLNSSPPPPPPPSPASSPMAPRTPISKLLNSPSASQFYEHKGMIATPSTKTSTAEQPFSKLKPMKLQFFKTKMCPWVIASGHCRKSAHCRYAHAIEELRPLPDLSKTKMCPDLLQAGRCQNPLTCSYAHCYEELRATQSFSKTKLCPAWIEGYCMAGGACRFAHGEDELRARNLASASTTCVSSGNSTQESHITFQTPQQSTGSTQQSLTLPFSTDTHGGMQWPLTSSPTRTWNTTQTQVYSKSPVRTPRYECRKSVQSNVQGFGLTDDPSSPAWQQSSPNRADSPSRCLDNNHLVTHLLPSGIFTPMTTRKANLAQSVNDTLVHNTLERTMSGEWKTPTRVNFSPRPYMCNNDSMAQYVSPTSYTHRMSQSDASASTANNYMCYATPIPVYPTAAAPQYLISQQSQLTPVTSQDNPRSPYMKTMYGSNPHPETFSQCEGKSLIQLMYLQSAANSCETQEMPCFMDDPLSRMMDQDSMLQDKDVTSSLQMAEPWDHTRFNTAEENEADPCPNINSLMTLNSLSRDASHGSTRAEQRPDDSKSLTSEYFHSAPLTQLHFPSRRDDESASSFSSEENAKTQNFGSSSLLGSQQQLHCLLK